MRTLSRCVMTEANKYTRKSAVDDLDEKVKIWGNAAPLMNLDKPANETSLETLMKFKFLMNGGFHLKEDLEYFPLQTREEDQTATSSSNDEGGY